MYYVKKQIHLTPDVMKKYNGHSVTIAILDSGIQEHVELQGRIKASFDYVHYRNRIYDDYGHGTHVAGIIAGNQIGIAPKASLVSYKVLDHRGFGEGRDSFRALNDIFIHRDDLGIKIINISFGFIKNQGKYMEDLILDYMEKLWKSGIIIVAAAGNEGPSKSSITIPGSHPMIITVGTSDAFSGKGPTEACIVKPEVLAPGRHILSLSNRNSYEYRSGTSMAAPVVSGAIALALDKNPKLSPKDLKLALYRSCDPLSTKPEPWGLLNIKKLLMTI